ncbi:hypothetical protein HHK36_009635 [Tetracentron sinense]|uniref:rhamnogalacturonan endolyase n=1 Tax=Tetracentron sinense TaxID=13715 RepID=A0A835DIJ7_TETSI|nr:hypothetical protein HHK36_009635 [Tetracentron sinense]
MDNGILQVTLSNPGGFVLGIRYNGIDNLLESHNRDGNRGYWDVVWSEPRFPGSYDRTKGTSFKVIMQNENQVELSFVRTWNSFLTGTVVPLNIDKRFIMLNGSSGFYSYAIYERLEGWPDFNVDQIRIVFKLRKDKFDYMAISDYRQRIMPTAEDRARGEPLAYPEAVLLRNPSNSYLKGEVDDKYQYSCEDRNNRVHGWISFDPPVGFWMITPSDEFRTGGPLKQDLTSHVGPTTLSMFVSTHYAGEDLGMKFKNGEPWKKVFGPVFIYLNSVPDRKNLRGLWDDAKEQMSKEVKSWPYSFPVSEDFPSSDQRGTITGRLLVLDRYINAKNISANSAYVGLALPGDVGSWQRETKGYQFWTRSDIDGRFFINGVRVGDYSLYAWVPGFIGDYRHYVNVTITPGSKINLGDIVYEPPRSDRTLWEIGVPDRSAAEFYVPNPNPNYINRLYVDQSDNYRQYGLWERYTDLYPDEDLVYRVGISNYRRDWFFAHVTRRTMNNTYKPTTWRITFALNKVSRTKTYYLRLALASASFSELQVRVNDPTEHPPPFTTGLIGRDNSIARHGIHGLYHLYSVEIPGNKLWKGNNTIFLTQSRCLNAFEGIMYDYIRLEGPPASS